MIRKRDKMMIEKVVKLNEEEECWIEMFVESLVGRLTLIEEKGKERRKGLTGHPQNNTNHGSGHHGSRVSAGESVISAAYQPPPGILSDVPTGFAFQTITS